MGCGDGSSARIPEEPAAGAASRVGADRANPERLRTAATESDVALLGDLGLTGAAAAVPDPDTLFPIEGPRKGALFSLGAGRGFYEYAHNEHWGTASLYLYDAAMVARDFDVPPVLNVLDEEASTALAPTRESFDEVVDGGWHFEDDLLLGYPAAARFRLHVDDRTYTPLFEHVHVGHGGGPAHANEHATGAHAHGPGPQGGVVLTLGTHRAHVEVVHKAHWGILGLYVYDAAMTPRGIDEAPVLNVVCDDQPLQLTAGTENWDGEEDGGWHFEDDALLGETQPGRFRLEIDGKTYTPPFVYHAHGEEPGHSHDAGGS
jgi:hypothetical protein